MCITMIKEDEFTLKNILQAYILGSRYTYMYTQNYHIAFEINFAWTAGEKREALFYKQEQTKLCLLNVVVRNNFRTNSR